MVGGDFAANLSRVGEKDNYDYLVRWILNPRTQDAALFAIRKAATWAPRITQSTTCRLSSTSIIRAVPNDGHELVVQQPTVMPSLRLTVDDARDIASFLLTQKHADASYAPAPFMDDPHSRRRARN